MLRLFLIAIVTTIFIGCSSSSSSSSESESESSYLSPPLAPINNSLVPITQSISLEFSAVMDPSSFSEETLYIKDDNGDVVSSTYTQDGDYIVVLTPSSYFKMNTEYSVTVDVGIKDTDGRTLSKPYSFTFITENSGGDTTPIVIELVKPLNHVTSLESLVDGDVDVSTRIAIQFNKDVDISKNPSLVVKKLTNGSSEVIAGTTEIKGSVLIFKPDVDVALDAYADYEVEITDTTLVQDLYGNVFSATADSAWFFKTKENSISESVYDSYNLQDNVGHKELASVFSIEGTPLGMALHYDEDTSKLFLAVASSSGLEMYNVNPNTQALTTHSTIAFNSEIKTLKSANSILAVGTAKDGVYFYVYDSDSAQFAGLPYSDSGNMGPVYGIDAKEIGGVSYVVVVSPTTGLYIFNLTSVLEYDVNHVTKEKFSPIDVKFIDGKIEVANFESGVDIFSVDGTYESSTALDGSTRHIGLASGTDSFYANTLGIIYKKADGAYKPLASFAKDFFGYEEILNSVITNNMLYVVDEDKGISTIDTSGNNYRSRVTLNTEKIVSAIVYKNMTAEYSYMMVLGANKSIHLFNAVPDIISPTVASGLAHDPDMYKVTINFSEFIDVTTLVNNITYTTDSDNGVVTFSMSIGTTVDGMGTQVILTPDTTPYCSTECRVRTTTGIKDIIGNTHTANLITFTDA